MASGAQPWDLRYRSEGYSAGAEPAAFLREVLPLLTRGRALDLATGAGRNAVFLAAHGWQVTGIDSSRVALEKAEALAREQNLTVHWAEQWPTAKKESSFRGKRGPASKAPGLLLVKADLENLTPPAAQFELVLCFNYLQRSLFTAIERALQPGGMLVYETYTIEQLVFPSGPRNPAHLLRANELRQAFPGLEILFYREFRAGKGIASLLARKPASKRSVVQS